MYLTDRTRLIKIEMQVWGWKGSDGFSPDWSNDFFESGCLPYDGELDAYEVEDIDYCIEQAQEWEDEDENNFVSWRELVIPIKLEDGHILREGDWISDGNRIVEVQRINDDSVQVSEMELDDNGGYTVVDRYYLTRHEIKNFVFD